jgi:hypothetical protein
MEVSGQLNMPAALTLGIGLPVPIGKEAGCSSEPIWALWRREESLAFIWNQTLIIQSIA